MARQLVSSGTRSTPYMPTAAAAYVPQFSPAGLGSAVLIRFIVSNANLLCKKIRNRIAVYLLALLVAGCFGVPQEQLAGFASSFSEARTAGLLVYDEIYPAVRAEAEHTGEVDAATYPITLGPSTLGASDCEVRYVGASSVVARCNAFAAAVAYNEALLALAQGAPSELVLGKVRGALTGITGVAAAIGTGGVATFLSGPAVTALTGILEQALKLNDQAQLKAKLDEGAPQVRQLLAALHEDAGRVYIIARLYFENRLVVHEDEALVAMAPLVQVAIDRAPPTDANTLVAFRAAEGRLDALLGRKEPPIGETRLSNYMNPAGTPLTADEVARITNGIVPAEVALLRFDAVGAEWQPIRQSIVVYQAMLTALDKTFGELVRASNDPFASGGTSAQLAQSIAAIRENAKEIEGLLN